jgi:hypothetical protein
MDSGNGLVRKLQQVQLKHGILSIPWASFGVVPVWELVPAKFWPGWAVPPRPLKAGAVEVAGAVVPNPRVVVPLVCVVGLALKPRPKNSTET